MTREKKTESFLEKYDNAPESEKWGLVLKWFTESPTEFFKELREKRPVMETPEGVLLARFDDTVEILSQPAMFTVKFYKPKMGNYLMTQDGTIQHDTEKKIMTSWLDKLDMVFVRDFIGKTAKDLLDKAGGKIEMAYDYGRMVPAIMVGEIFGLGGINPRNLIRWSYWNQFDTFHNQPFHRRSDAKKISRTKNANNLVMGIYLVILTLYKLAANATGKRGKDVTSQMLAGHYSKNDKFTLPRKVLNTGGLLIGSVETTSQAVIQVLEELFNRPDMFKKAVELARSNDEKNTKKFDLIVWEALRFNANFKYMFRTASADYTLARGTKRETLLRKDVTVFPLIYSAMFDSAEFKDPYTFKPERPYGNAFHFGYGYHECMGKMIGMVLVPEMVRQVLLRNKVKPDEPIDYKNGPLPEKWNISWKE